MLHHDALLQTFSPDFFGGGDNDACLVMKDGGIESMVCCLMIFSCGMDTSKTTGDLS